MKEDNRNYLSVSEYNAYIKDLLDSDMLLKNVFVMGEVSDLSPRGDHLFFTLKDEYCKMSVVVLGYRNTYTPKMGETVMVMGTPDYYERGGKLNFNAYNIEPVGLGMLYRKLEELKEKLALLGYFDREHKKSLPKYPQSIGILSSIDGAVFFDIFQSIRKINEVCDITLIDIRVQGAGAAQSIIKALKAADTMGFDLLILARGGGSFEDLLCFSDEEVVKTIYRLNTPVISAIGHETDNPLSDYVADARAITPTEAGKMSVYNTAVVKAEIMEKILLCKKKLEKKFRYTLLKVTGSAKRVGFTCGLALNGQIGDLKERLRIISDKAKEGVTAKEAELKLASLAMDKLNPAKVLSKGYFGVTKNDIKVTQIDDLEIGDKIELIGADGKACAVVNSKEVRQ
ncbi:MAG: exodeoxyribonuclease VII large subunit [Christensenellales bacterium]|jgi:exodeoxyribonuclease VII large subunit